MCKLSEKLDCIIQNNDKVPYFKCRKSAVWCLPLIVIYIQTDVYIKYLATCILLISEIMSQVLLSEKGGFQLLTVMV